MPGLKACRRGLHCLQKKLNFENFGKEENENLTLHLVEFEGAVPCLWDAKQLHTQHMHTHTHTHTHKRNKKEKSSPLDVLSEKEKKVLHLQQS
jgi:hypothetical protein